MAELQNHIIEIRKGLKAGVFVNEASVSQGIVLRLLQALDWPIFDSEIVSPEYSVQGRRVDFALCHPPKKPLVFIEVKKVGKSEGADRQLFEYAFHLGIPLAILTDGQEWHFYLPGEQGDYQDRRVYKLDILGREIEECELRLRRYLDYAASRSKSTIEAAKQDYRDVDRKRQIDQTLPRSLQQLISDKDEQLIKLVADKVEILCGYRPEPDRVSSFLNKLTMPVVQKSEPTIQPQKELKNISAKPSQRIVKLSRGKASPKRLRVDFSDGTSIQESTAAATLVEVINRLGVEKVKQLGLRSRPSKVCQYDLVADYPNEEQSPQQLGRYFIHTKSSTPEKKKTIEQLQSRLGEIKNIELI